MKFIHFLLIYLKAEKHRETVDLLFAGALAKSLQKPGWRHTAAENSIQTLTWVAATHAHRPSLLASKEAASEEFQKENETINQELTLQYEKQASPGTVGLIASQCMCNIFFKIKSPF